MVYTKYFCHLTILLLSFCFMVVKCSLNPADQFIYNASDIENDARIIVQKRPSFYVGSRYGRSGSSSGSSVFATSKTRRLNVVPRNDRFFLGSRYGKRTGMDYSKTNNKNNNKNINENSIFAPLLSTPYEQALISEISSGTQLSSKPVPSQQQQQFNDDDDFNTNHVPTQHKATSSLSSSALPPYAYMSCVYTGLQNYYRCNSIDSKLHFKNPVINDNDDDDDDEALATDRTLAALFNNEHDDGVDDDNDMDEMIKYKM